MAILQGCTIYLDTTLAPAFNPWSYYKKDTNQFSQRIVDWVNKFSDNGQAVIDSLNINQTKYSPQDFQLCIAKIKSARELPLDKPKCYIGKIILSRLVLNKAKDNGLLYYEFTCGGLCGYGRLIMVERNKSFWSIKELLTIWIS